MTERGGYDYWLLAVTAVLTAIGVLMVYSSSSIMAAEHYKDGFYFLKRQGGFALFGMLLLVAAMRFDYHHLRRFAALGLLVSAVLLALVLVPGIGSSAGGAVRWIRIAGFSLQPSEMAKLALVLFMAHSLARKPEKSLRTFKFGVLPYLIILGMMLVMLMFQPDLGSAMTMGAVAMGMMLIAGTAFKHLLISVLPALPALYVAIWRVDYRRRRIMAFMDPWKYPSDEGFQITQSLIAFANGGWKGRGLGQSQQKLFFLPEAHTDFIFSVVGEEAGFIGVLTIAVLFLVLVWLGLRIAWMAPDEFGRYLAFGLTLLLGLEAFTNMAVVMSLLPTKGLALPFLSYGGSSLVMSLVAVGVLLNVSSQIQGGRA
jgi:cell division protein FtsW